MTQHTRNILLAGGIILTAASVLLYRKSGGHSAHDSTGTVPFNHKTKSTVTPRPEGHLSTDSTSAARNLPAPVPSPHPPGSAADGDWIAARISAIHELEWFDDAASLRKILAELRNPLPQIRAAAVEATRAFGSRDAIPYLATRAAETGDLLEQKALMDLIAHLKLPTVVEQLDEEAEK